jgi:hypothetical protein
MIVDIGKQWYEDIKALTEKSPQERNAFVRQHARSISGTSQRSNSRAGSVSSDGIMDEEDDEPFSATNSEIVSQGPKQDVLPKRPQPGGRFPSDLEIGSSRGLQVPLSPSSGSSGFGDVQDRNVIAAAGALPGSGIGQHYGEDNSPTHAALVNQYAKEDGVNPYTNEPVSPGKAQNQHTPDGVVAGGAGLGGTVLGAAGYKAYQKHEEDKAANEQGDFRKQQEKQAVLEASTIAAPDTYEQESEQGAVHEADAIVALDTPLTVDTFGSDMVLGARNQDTLGARSDLMSDTSPEKTKPQTDNVSNPIEAGLAKRPSLAAGENHLSASSISQLHVPGEFPKSTGV